MTEFDELTAGRTLDQLYKELGFQITIGNPVGGVICSHILDAIKRKQNAVTESKK